MVEFVEPYIGGTMPEPSAASIGSPKSVRAAELGEQIRAATAANPVEIALSTSQRIIARVTDGIYREPWAAFRELCANAYDADANEVVIETGAPSFDQVTVRDDGLGMSPATLAWLVENIGGSSKRTEDGVILHTANAADPELSPAGRPLIGKIGIGLFAVAQLTQHFQIITKARGEPFRSWATVRLRTHTEASLKSSKQEIWQAGTAKIVSEAVAAEEIESHGTTIILHDLRPEIRNLLQSQARWASTSETDADGDNLAPPPKYHIGRQDPEQPQGHMMAASPPWTGEPSPTRRFDAIVEAASETFTADKSASSLDHLDEYYKSVWKLALSLPLPYLEEHPFEFAGQDGLITYGFPPRARAALPLDLEPRETLRGRLELKSGRPDPAGGFSVIFDGIRLLRPIKLPAELTRSSRIKAPVILAAKVRAPFDEDALERAGGSLAFEAYLYWNSTVTPKDVQGVLLRVREASGTLFDRKFMDYQVSEQTRLSQVTAEIFVTEGLDGALNIDRESFNYSHPHYIYIKKWLHAALKLLFNRLKALAKEDLDREKTDVAVAKSHATVESAMDVWRARKGSDADPPTIVAVLEPTRPPSIMVQHWADRLDPSVRPAATAISIILEAYGLRQHLSVADEESLIRAILEATRG
jgi:hypothetical protein